MAHDRIARERIRALSSLIKVLRRDRIRSDDKFETSIARRFETVNEFRQALTDLSATMATRREMEAFEEIWRRSHQELEKAVGELRSRLDSGPVELREVARQNAVEAGRREGTRLVIASIYAVTGIVIGIVTAVVIFYH